MDDKSIEARGLVPTCSLRWLKSWTRGSPNDWEMKFTLDLQQLWVSPGSDYQEWRNIPVTQNDEMREPSEELRSARRKMAEMANIPAVRDDE